ncbi:unnamed protein product [Enterobius vermicularis]|uniref:Uncharacterized protein n=1 Tax=Enterobius vermicularis TaxID=51028 RepID=A0A0N4VR69_ENTVE|nr:unnamed protein product [Enterobius vermicularis]
MVALDTIEVLRGACNSELLILQRTKYTFKVKLELDAAPSLSLIWGVLMMNAPVLSSKARTDAAQVDTCTLFNTRKKITF